MYCKDCEYFVRCEKQYYEKFGDCEHPKVLNDYLKRVTIDPRKPNMYGDNERPKDDSQVDELINEIHGYEWEGSVFMGEKFGCVHFKKK